MRLPFLVEWPTLREAGVSQKEVAKFLSKSMRGDYGHFLRVTMRWVDVR